MSNQVSLYKKQGSADKEYHAQLKSDGNGFVVNFQYGRRGKPLRTGTKTKSPLPLVDAQKIYDKLVKSKIAGDYTADTSGTISAMQKVGDKTHSGFYPMLLKEGRFDDVAGGKVVFGKSNDILQEKYDGENRSVIIEGDSVTGVDKKGYIVSLSEDTVAECLKLNLKGRFILAGEEMGGGRIVCFDIASSPDDPDGQRPFGDRLAHLYTILEDANTEILVRAQDNLMMSSDAFIAKLQDENAEGFVSKTSDGSYTQSARDVDQIKYKFLDTVSCVVAKQNDGKRSVLMKMFDNLGHAVEVGNITIPPNAEIPKVGAIIEVEYLYAYEGGSLCQPVFKKERKDIDESDCGLSTLKYKREESVLQVEENSDSPDDSLSMGM